MYITIIPKNITIVLNGDFMELRRIEVDDNLREPVYFKDGSFPVGIWTDVYSTLMDHTLNCHWHDVFEFGVMLSGKLDYYMNGTHIRLQNGDCVFINSNTIHMATQCEDCKDAIMFTLAFPPSLFTLGTNSSVYQKYFRPIIGSPIKGFKIDSSTPNGKIIVEMLKQVYSLSDAEYGYELRCLGLLCQVWNSTMQYISEHGNSFVEANRKHKDEEKAKDVLTYIHEHYTESISIHDITTHIGISRSECFRCVRRFANKKPVEYINEYRLALAAKMLKETNFTVSEIGTACGFSSSSYFGKLFKEKYSLTPFSYRQNRV